MKPVLDPALALRRLQHELEHPPFHAFLRPEAIAADAQCVEIRLPYRAEFRRDASTADVHGGVIAALIDLAAHATVAVQIGRMAPTIDLRIDFLRPAPGVDLIARARTLSVGQSVARADVEIYATGMAKPVAVGRGAFSTRAPSTGGEPINEEDSRKRFP